MKLLSVFNNKGGVGKTTLTFHLAYALSELGHRTLAIDLDPQCNLTIMAMDSEDLHRVWISEDDFVDDFQAARNRMNQTDFDALVGSGRSIHFLLKPTEDGAADLPSLSPPLQLAPNLDLIPGRLSMHLYEDKISSRWSEIYQGDPLAIRTVTKIRELARNYSRQHGYEFVILDTSPSLGSLNKVIISTADGFLIPCMPDMFSLYGVRNIGSALRGWEKQFSTIRHLLSAEKLQTFPQAFVQLLGFTIYNAKKYAGRTEWDLAQAHYNYAMQIRDAIPHYIDPDIRNLIPTEIMSRPVGNVSIMHTHNTLPAMAQKYHKPMWLVPSVPDLEASDSNTILGNRQTYESTRAAYERFAQDLLSRLAMIG